MRLKLKRVRTFAVEVYDTDTGMMPSRLLYRMDFKSAAEAEEQINKLMSPVLEEEEPEGEEASTEDLESTFWGNSHDAEVTEAEIVPRVNEGKSFDTADTHSHQASVGKDLHIVKTPDHPGIFSGHPAKEKP